MQQSNDNVSDVLVSDFAYPTFLKNESQLRFPTPHNGLFPLTTGSRPGDKFISGLSVAMLVIFFFMLRSSASPFLNPSSEARKAASSSLYFSLSCFLFIWVSSVTILTIVPHFTSHYNGVIAAALFFPMTFSSIAALVAGRFVVRSIFYCVIQSGIYDSQEENQRTGRKVPKMVAFQRPFRKLAKSAAVVSAILSLLYAHCWSRALSVFKVNKADGAGAICRAVFTPFAYNSVGADEYSIWILWGTIMLIMVFAFAQDEFNGLHCCSNISIKRRSKKSTPDFTVESDDDDYLGYSSEDSSDNSDTAFTETRSKRSIFNLRLQPLEVPQGTLPMVPWLSLFAAHTVLDIFLQLKVFLGRVDARLMQPALQQRGNFHTTNESNNKVSAVKKLQCFQMKYPGCVYDYSSRARSSIDNGFWFDFMADCGEGFNSSYHVARLLAQQSIVSYRNGKPINLPRGQILVIGGDLAYPNPSEHAFEKRFFRTFEDAMPPPPSFRRNKIATNKLEISAQGWDKDLCFENTGARKNNEKDIHDDMHELYKGPSTFIIPGNHDWYDGLATYSKLILCRDFLGGWLMPQQRSYFVIKLIEGWWIFGFDCGMAADIDIEQFKFFADVADNVVGPSDSVIIVNHEPHWVTDYDAGKSGDELSERNIYELMEHHLRGKVRARLAGDLHHYTRHVPTKATLNEGPRRITRSYSFNCAQQQQQQQSDNDKKVRVKSVMEPFTEENKPELVVSGGGGAFLHGTATYAKDIKVGPKQQKYSRVVAYPNEIVSAYLGWLNMSQFRSRGWRCDLVFAGMYLGFVSSLLPLCGIYDDYEAFNPEHDPVRLLIWTTKMIGSLILRVVSTEHSSLLCLCGFLLGALALQYPEHHIKPMQRYFLALCHAFGHITAALACLIFVQCTVEWIVKEHIVTIATSERHPFSPPKTGIAGSIYDEYKIHFYPVYKNFTHAESILPATESFSSGFMSSIASQMNSSIKLVSDGWDFIFTHVPLLRTTLKVFDLPSLIAQNHNDMCQHLCADGIECLLSHDAIRFQSIGRGIFVPYLAGIALYLIFITVPLAGSIFGTWLALSLNIFKCQSDLAFSSLQIEHYKNFVRLHIKENGELEIFAVGLPKVPTKWVKDSSWEGNHHSKKRKVTSRPSWLWQHPSKWIPNSKYAKPQIIDYTCIPKRTIQRASDDLRKNDDDSTATTTRGLSMYGISPGPLKPKTAWSALSMRTRSEGNLS